MDQAPTMGDLRRYAQDVLLKVCRGKASAEEIRDCSVLLARTALALRDELEQVMSVQAGVSRAELDAAINPDLADVTERGRVDFGTTLQERRGPQGWPQLRTAWAVFQADNRQEIGKFSEPPDSFELVGGSKGGGLFHYFWQFKTSDQRVQFYAMQSAEVCRALHPVSRQYFRASFEANGLSLDE